MDHGYERVTPGDPMQCQWTNGMGQCRNRKVHQSEFCPAHGGLRAEANRQQAEVTKYRLRLYQARVNEFANDNEIKSLREEIGILRMTLEHLLNSLDNPNKLLIFIDKIQALVSQIQKTVESAQRMEEKTNTLIDRRTIFVIGDSIVSIIAEHVKDSDVLSVISERICQSIESAASIDARIENSPS